MGRCHQVSSQYITVLSASTRRTKLFARRLGVFEGAANGALPLPATNFNCRASKKLNFLRQRQSGSLVKNFCLHPCLIYCSTWGTIKINDTPKVVYSPISKLHSILAVPNLLAHNDIIICYDWQINSLRLKSSVASKYTSKHLLEYHLFWCWWYMQPRKQWCGHIGPWLWQKYIFCLNASIFFLLQLRFIFYA